MWMCFCVLVTLCTLLLVSVASDILRSSLDCLVWYGRTVCTPMSLHKPLAVALAQILVVDAESYMICVTMEVCEYLFAGTLLGMPHAQLGVKKACHFTACDLPDQ